MLHRAKADDSEHHDRDEQHGEPSSPPPRDGEGDKGPDRSRMFLWALFSFVIAYWIVSAITGGPDHGPKIAYTTFREHLDQGRLQQVRVKGEQIDGDLREEALFVSNGDSTRYDQFVTYLPSFGDEDLLSDLRQAEVEIETERESDTSWWSVLIGLAPLLFLFLLGFLFLRGMASQGRNMLSIGRSQAKRAEPERERTTFDDVAGAEGAKSELRELVQYLKSPGHFQALGAAVPKGVLLVGPPGTGKTLLARAVAGEADVPFFIITGSDFMEMFVGVGAKRVRDLFEDAKKNAPSIIFIDELDSVGRHRGAGLGGGHDEREQTLNQLLSELDGFEPSENVIVMAATNRPDILDPALLRPGRFDRHIAVELPSSRERAAILRIHARGKPLSDDLDLDQVARGTPGFSGADLQNLLNEAAFTAAREDHEAIQPSDMDEARDRVLMGLERRGLALSDRQVELLAYHEGGHTLVSAVLPHADPIHKVTIVPRGRSMGATHQMPEDDRYVYERDYMLDRLAVMLAGRAAENVALDTTTTGAEDDLRQATSLARRMVVDWGMGDDTGLMVSSQGSDQEVFLGEELTQRRENSEATARLVDDEVRSILEQSYRRAVQVIEEHRDGLDRIARALIEDEKISGERVEELLAESGAPQ